MQQAILTAPKYETISRHGHTFVIAPSGECVGRITQIRKQYRVEHEAYPPFVAQNLKSAINCVVALDEHLDRVADGRSQVIEVAA